MVASCRCIPLSWHQMVEMTERAFELPQTGQLFECLSHLAEIAGACDGIAA